MKTLGSKMLRFQEVVHARWYVNLYEVWLPLCETADITDQIDVYWAPKGERTIKWKMDEISCLACLARIRRYDDLYVSKKS